MTWDEILSKADDCKYDDEALEVKEYAMSEMRNFVKDINGKDIYNVEDVDVEIACYCDSMNVQFDKNGSIIDFKLPFWAEQIIYERIYKAAEAEKDEGKMTKQKLLKMTFTDVVKWMYENVDYIVSVDELKDKVKDALDKNQYYLVDHLVKALKLDWSKCGDVPCDYWFYDMNMGTLDTPIPIESWEDIDDILDALTGYFD